MPTIPANNNTGLYNTTGNAVPTNGNISTNNITASGNVTVGGYIIANGSITTNANFVGDLIGNVTGNITLSGGNTEVIYNNSGVTGSSPNFTFNSATTVLDVNGNVQANYFIGDGSQLTGLPAGYSNANVVTLLAAFGSNTISTTGNITGGYILGNGSQLTGIPAQYGNANVSAFLPTYTGNLGANTIVATGNITGLNLKTSGAGGNITGAEYVSATYFVGDGSLLTNVASSFGNANVGAYLTTYTGNISAGNITVSEDVVVTGDVTAGVFYGTFAGNISGNITVPGSNTWVLYNDAGNAGADSDFTFNSDTNTMTVTGTANLTAINATTITATGNISGGNISGSGAGLSNLAGANVTGTVANAAYATAAGTATTATTATSAITANTVTDAAQANITSVGTLTSLAVSGNISGGNISTAGVIAGSGAGLTSIPGANVTGTVANAAYATSAGSAATATTAGTVTNAAQANITSVGTLTSLAVSGNATVTGNVVASVVQASGSGGLALKNAAGTTQASLGAGGGDNFAINVSTNLNGTNAQIDISPTGTGHVHIKPTGTGAVEIAPTNPGTVNNMVIGNATPLAANFTTVGTTGNITAVGNISGAYILGNGSQLTGIAASYGNAEVAAFLPTYTGAMTAMTGNLTTTANVAGGNLLASGEVIASGDVRSGSGQSVWAGTVEIENDSVSPAAIKIKGSTDVIGGFAAQSVTVATGNVYGANLVSGGAIDATGNITGAYIIGNGSGLTNITGANISGTVANAAYATNASTVTNPAQANITSVGTLTSLTSSGNITGANLVATDSVFAGSLKSVWVGTAQLENDNASPASLKVYAPTTFAAGVTATGNIVGGNLYTAGNITGSYIFGNGSQLTGITSSAGGSNTQIQYNNAGAFGGAAVFSFNNATGNVAAGNIVIQANTTSTGAAQNIYTNSNQYFGNAAATPVLGRMLFGSGLSTSVGGSGDFSNNVDPFSNMRGARMVLADRFQKTDNGVRSRSFVSTQFVDVSGTIGAGNNNSRVGGTSSEMFVGGGNIVSTNPLFMTNITSITSVGNNGNATVGNANVTVNSGYVGYMELRPGSTVTNSIGFYPTPQNNSGNAAAFGNYYGISPTTGGNAAITNFSLIHMQNGSGNGWGISSSFPPTNYYFLNNTDVRSESIVGPIRQYQDKTYLEATGSGTVAVDWDNGTSQVINLSGDMTLTFQDPTVGTTNQRLIHTVTLVIYQDGTGRSVTLPTPSTTYRYAGGTSTVGTTANAVTMITISAIRVSGATQYLITVSPEFTG